ncbi:hypothetical protein [Microbacterium soli]|uniref:Response regulatory domain-containing protein n=1 Tax=Microbacterium soli TaxID=446075 RepID=A0ABP7MYL4_9MICO
MTGRSVRGRRAAVIEPHVLQRRAAVQVLVEHGGLEVVHGGDRLGGLLTWMRSKDRRRWPHLLVVEMLPLQQPDHDLAALAALREAGVRVLALSSLTPRWGARRVMEAGVDGVVAKSDDVGTLIEAVERVLSGDRVMTPAAETALAFGDDAPRLSPQEASVLELYVGGRPIASVAEAIGVREDTARKYLTRIKQKYEALGRPARSKLDLARHAWHDGFADLRAPMGGGGAERTAG